MPAPAAAWSSLDAALGAAVWRADQLGRQVARGVPSQFAALDAELPGGGWPVGSLTELLIERHGIGELRLVLPALAQRARGGGEVLWVAPPFVPYAPALQQYGLALDRVLVVHAPQRADRLWAIEQALGCAGVGALIAWLPEDDGTLVAADRIRRLQLAAQGTRSLAFLVRPQAARSAASPAPLRLQLAPAGADQERLRIDILKRRGPPLAAPLALALPPVVPTGAPTCATVRAANDA
ncbi:MAG: translesion DNA synthesis-associated protein ImuA [Burkholderiaceae bacterium]